MMRLATTTVRSALWAGYPPKSLHSDPFRWIRRSGLVGQGSNTATESKAVFSLPFTSVDSSIVVEAETVRWQIVPLHWAVERFPLIAIETPGIGRPKGLLAAKTKGKTS